MTKKTILDDLINYGLSQWFGKNGLCSVMEDGETCNEKTYRLIISTGVSLRDGNILEEYKGIFIDQIIDLANK